MALKQRVTAPAGSEELATQRPTMEGPAMSRLITSVARDLVREVQLHRLLQGVA